MKTLALVRAMHALARDHGKRIFTLREICGLTGEPRERTAMTLTRAGRSGIVARAGTVWLNMMDPPELLDVALAAESPSYVSFESALYVHGVLSQSPRAALTMATARRPRVLGTVLGEVRYFHLSRDRFFGYDERRIATPEKALLDLAYIRGLRGREGAIPEDLYLDRIDRKALERMARRFPAWVVRLAISRTAGRTIRHRP